MSGRSASKSRQSTRIQKIGMKNVNHPGQVKYVDADMYKAMKIAFLKALPKRSPE